jgi:hypothetical protein
MSSFLLSFFLNLKKKGLLLRYVISLVIKFRPGVNPLRIWTSLVKEKIKKKVT